MELQTIHTPDHKIIIGNVFEALEKYLLKGSYSKYILFMDENTSSHCYPVIKKLLDNIDLEHHYLTVKSGEHNKTLRTCEYLWDGLTALRADRNSLVINLSGGVLSDMGGFVAATFKRGVPFINIPTTLLSMVDASIGGKLAIDFNGLKNHIGLFKNPARVFIYPGFLKTLPVRELYSGFAEIIKHGLIADASYFDEVQQAGNPAEITDEQWAKFISRSVEIKNQIVEADPFEAGRRKVLNFGHTAGHAIESWSLNSSDPLKHGEAIAIGMVIETYLSTLKGGMKISEARQVTNYLAQIFSPYHGLQQPNFGELVGLMRQDKKNFKGNILFTLLEAKGEAIFDARVNEEEIKEAIQYYLNSVS